MNSKRLKYLFSTFCKWFFGILGFLLFIAVILSFTDLPYLAYHKLGIAGGKLTRKPDLIVVLGGSGMPSPDGLIRTYYAAQAANVFKDAGIIIALPYNEHDSLYQLQLMAHELIIKGIDSTRISFEPLGFNTHSQAQNIASMYGSKKTSMFLLIITSPQHMYRSIKTFRRAGFLNAAGMPSFEKPVDAVKIADIDDSEDVRVKSLALRYNMWSYLDYELIVVREYIAIIYYKLKGWI